MKVFAFLALTLFGAAVPASTTDHLTEYLANKHSDEDKLRQLLQSGTMDGFFTTQEIEDVFDHLSAKYQGLVNKVVIGKSFQGHDIYAYRLRSSKDPAARKSKVLFTGLHHARELITANMVVKIFIETLHSLVHGTTRFTFWNFCDLVIIPVVNVDSHRLISQTFGTDEFEAIRDKRKNMNDRVCPDGSVVEQGVDLNRNYGFHYGEDTGDNDECGETFRGINAFSEPETRAVRDFLTGETGIVSAMNFHSYGNMWIHPFNYMKVANKFPDYTARAVVNFYQEFGQEVAKVSESGYGNAIEMVKYSTDGEASDWMLGELGIVSFSPELGSLNPDAQDFIIPQNLIAPVIWENFKVIELFLEKNSFQLRNLSFGFDNNGAFTITLENAGLATIFDPVLTIQQTPSNEVFLRAVSKVEFEVRPSEIEEGRFEGRDGVFVVVFDKINRLDRLKITFHLNNRHVHRHSFALNCQLAIQAGYHFSSFELKHTGLTARRRLTLVAAGACFGMAVMVAAFLLGRLVSWMRRKKPEADDLPSKELNC